MSNTSLGFIEISGVVAAVDAGSFGCSTWHKSNQFLMDTANQKVKLFMHVLPVGLTGFPLRNFTQVESVDLDRVIETAKQDRSGLMARTPVLDIWLR